MSDRHHFIEVSIAEIGRNRGKSKNVILSAKRFMRRFHAPSVDNSTTFADYQAMSADEKSLRKEAPGSYVAGHFKDGSRKKADLLFRSMIILDLDHVTADQAALIRQGLAEICRYFGFMHTTRSHCAMKPRIRLVLFLSRNVDADEAEAITRYVSLLLAADPAESIEIPDLVSFRPNQIMYWPSISKGQEYWFEELGGDELLDPDAFLAGHANWRDVSTWPRQEQETTRRVGAGAKKMEDPREKPGVIGAFCRVYDVEEAIAEFLPDIYTPGTSTTETRYTYALGTGSNGAVVYDGGLFLHSNHGSDPIDGSVNAWDLVRIHLFGHLDADAREGTSPFNMPSHKAMVALAEKDPAVQAERSAAYAFDDEEPEDGDESSPETGNSENQAEGLDDIDDFLGLDGAGGGGQSVADKFDDADDENAPKKDRWQSRLTVDKQGKLEKTRHNAITIITEDSRIAPFIALNDLSGGPTLRGKRRFKEIRLVQAQVKDPVVGRRWTDNDTAALSWALSAPPRLKGYGTDFAQADLKAGMLQAAEANVFNPVLEKVRTVEWDGVKRVETVFIDFLGCIDNAYHREAAYVWFLAGITRLYEPGHRFDLVPILGGKQGGGKSGFIEALGLGFAGLLAGDFGHTQKMIESIRGKWVLEVPELKGFHRGLIEDIKQWFVTTTDTIRLAYRENEEDFPRRCVFMGTTNEDEYLKDATGNRRFLPILVTKHREDKIDFARLTPLIPQLWAEAHAAYLAERKAKPGGLLDLDLRSEDARAEARRLQEDARETAIHEPVTEVLEAWLDTPVSASEIAAPGARKFTDDGDDDARFVRNLVTTTMIRTEMRDNPIIRDLKGAPDKAIGAALRAMSDKWVPLGKARRLGIQARWFARVGQDSEAAWVPAGAVSGAGDSLLD